MNTANKTSGTANKSSGKKEVKKRWFLILRIEGGVMTLQDESDMMIYQYRQRGIQKIDEDTRRKLVACGFLRFDWRKFKEIPPHSGIYYEDEDIYGKARMTYPNPEKLLAVAMDRTPY